MGLGGCRGEGRSVLRGVRAVCGWRGGRVRTMLVAGAAV